MFPIQQRCRKASRLESPMSRRATEPKVELARRVRAMDGAHSHAGTGTCRRENPPWVSSAGNREAARHWGGLSFGYFSLAEQRKVTCVRGSPRIRNAVSVERTYPKTIAAEPLLLLMGKKKFRQRQILRPRHLDVAPAPLHQLRPLTGMFDRRCLVGDDEAVGQRPLQ